MNKKTKYAFILIYFAKQRRKESIEMKEEKADASRATVNTRAFQSTESDSTKEHITSIDLIELQMIFP